jgi:hypothetical protein
LVRQNFWPAPPTMLPDGWRRRSSPGLFLDGDEPAHRPDFGLGLVARADITMRWNSGKIAHVDHASRVLPSRRRWIDNRLGRTARCRLHVWRCASLWTCCWRAARARRERTGPALWLKLAFVVRQHSAPGAVRGIARLFVFALSLGRRHTCADDKAER